MWRSVKTVLFFILALGIGGRSVSAAGVFAQDTAPKKTHVFASEPANEPCTLTVYLHGHLTQPFEQDVIQRLRFEQKVKEAPGSTVLVPDLMSTCRRGIVCKSSYYDNFSMKRYLESAVAHLQSGGRCKNGVGKISLLGHSGIYSWLERGLLSELTPEDCSRPPGILGKVDNLVLIDSLFYTNKNSTANYQAFTEKVKKCDNGFRFAHVTRTMGSGYAPHNNSCRLQHGSTAPCRLTSEVSLDQPAQFLAADGKYSDYVVQENGKKVVKVHGHWDLVADSMPQWLKLFNRSSPAREILVPDEDEDAR